MNAADFVKVLEEKLGVGFYTGVPDSLLSPFTGEIMTRYGVCDKHVIAANEGNATGLAAGYYLATGKIPCIYMQNSGQGNMLNPYASLLAPDVYKIPAVFVVGWRGEPGTKDEPQHVFQGKITVKLMELLQIESEVITADTTIEELEKMAVRMKTLLENGACVGFVIEKGALETEHKMKYSNVYTVSREDALKLCGE